MAVVDGGSSYRRRELYPLLDANAIPGVERPERDPRRAIPPVDVGRSVVQVHEQRADAVAVLLLPLLAPRVRGRSSAARGCIRGVGRRNFVRRPHRSSPSRRPAATSLTLCALLATFPLPAQQALSVHPAPPPAGQAVRREGAIAVDGRLDEAAWARATPITGFRQFQPTEGAAAALATEVRFLFDDEALYVGGPRAARRIRGWAGGIQVMSRPVVECWLRSHLLLIARLLPHSSPT